MINPDELPDELLLDLLGKQVDRYNAIVSRLASNGVQVKTWCVTAVGAVSALAVNNDDKGLFGVGLAILALFFILDVFYLWLERRFREGGYRLAQKVTDGEVINMLELFTNRPPPRPSWGIGSVIRSTAIYPFYIVTASLSLIGLVAS